MMWLNQQSGHGNGSEKQKVAKVEKTDICAQLKYGTRHYSNLQAAIKDVDWWLEYKLFSIVIYNVQYRDCLRREGIEGLMARLLKEAPELAEKKDVLEGLGERLQKHLPLADFDIQCYRIKDVVTILGHEFRGWQDVRDHVDLMGTIRRGEFDAFSVKPKTTVGGMHVGCLYASYPVFDSYDLSDDRTYDNYLIRNRPITEAELAELAKVSYSYNYNRVNESLPRHLLPVLYYSGEGDCMLLATES
jgi:hypothetical protein